MEQQQQQQQPALSGLLEGVVALVYAEFASQTALTNKLRALGARVAGRFGKEVTHIIFQRRFQPSVQEKAKEEEDLRSIYDKLSKAGASQGWAGLGLGWPR